MKKTKKIKKTKLLILGSGPAGYSAALYAARANLNPLLITGIEKGGQLMQTNDIENWPGDYNLLSGPELMNRMNKHVLKFDVKIIFDQINFVNLKTYPFHLIGENCEYFTNALIIATGASAKYLNIPSEKKFQGKGVSACATCDGFFYRNKKVAVIGGGNTAIQESLYLSKIVKEVNLIHRRNMFKAEKILINRLEKNKNNNIIIHKDAVLEEIIGNENEIKKIKIFFKNKNKYKIIPVSGVFIAIGHTPNTYLFKNQLKLKNGYIVVKSGSEGSFTKTNIPGVFAAGDVMDSVYRQAITSAATGCMAAIDAENFLSINIL